MLNNHKHRSVNETGLLAIFFSKAKISRLQPLQWKETLVTVPKSQNRPVDKDDAVSMLLAYNHNVVQLDNSLLIIFQDRSKLIVSGKNMEKTSKPDRTCLYEFIKQGNET